MQRFTQVGFHIRFILIRFTYCNLAGLGACGIVNKDTDFIAAASKDLFDAFPCVSFYPFLIPLIHSMICSGYNGANPNKNPMCNRRVSATCEYNFLIAIL